MDCRRALWYNTLKGDVNMTNKERMLSGMLYTVDDELLEEQRRARRLTYKLNTMDRSEFKGIAEVIKELFGKSEGAFVNPPFYCDYGTNIEIGKDFFANYNCTILDVAKVRIGDNCLFAPNVALYTAGHPLHPDYRNTFYEYGAEINIGNNVWLGGNVVVCPGVTIGDNVVVGAGSVVTKDIPSWSLAVGNPCRVIRKIDERDKDFYFKNLRPDPEVVKIMDDIIENGCPGDNPFSND